MRKQLPTYLLITFTLFAIPDCCDFYQVLLIVGKTTSACISKTYGAHANDAFSRLDEQIIVGNVHALKPNHNNNIILGGAYTDALLDYIKAKDSLPKDILADYEEFNFQEDSAFSEDENTPHPHDKLTTEQRTTSLEHTVNSAEVSLSELAEKVTEDINEFFKTHSRSGSDAGSTRSSTAVSVQFHQTDDSISQMSDASDLTFSSTVEQPLHLRLNRELHIDKIISERHKLNSPSSRTFIYRSGITKAQLYYSKELASMYSIVTPQLLYLSESDTKESIKHYRSQLHKPTVNQVRILTF